MSEKPLPQELRDSIDAFLVSVNLERGYSDNTVCCYETDLLQLAEVLRGRRTILCWQDVTLEDLRNWLDILARDHLTSATISRKISTVRSFFKFCKQSNIVGENVALFLKRPQYYRSLPNSLSLDEIETLLSMPNATNPLGIRDAAMLELMYSSGLRVSELCDLLIQAIDLENKFVRVYGKGNKERTVPMGKAGAQKLNNYLTSSRPKLISHFTGSQLFITIRGRKISRKTFWLHLKKYAQLA
ncbi:MAG: tyrosine-type recombinase/integrase, partial [Puniceicoccales bacterium]|nr:tyrosine-type recombinase/integrase [Puniceicoccales bacterium]